MPQGTRPPRSLVLVVLTALTLIAFAANSLLCRAALGENRIDAASFTLIRLGSGALALTLLLALRGRLTGWRSEGTWGGAVALLVYALCFSLAYRSIPAAVGALVLFACVQLTMLLAAVRRHEGPSPLGWAGVVVAMSGLVALVAPGLDRPDVTGVALMALSGVAWGVYSLFGRGAKRPAVVTAASFLRATLLAVLPCVALGVATQPHARTSGVALAVLSGAVASGVGYVMWYAVLPWLGTARAAVLQLLVPVLAAVGGAAMLGERVGLRLLLAAAAILGGIALVFRAPRRLAP